MEFIVATERAAWEELVGFYFEVAYTKKDSSSKKVLKYQPRIVPNTQKAFHAIVTLQITRFMPKTRRGWLFQKIDPRSIKIPKQIRVITFKIPRAINANPTCDEVSGPSPRVALIVPINMRI